MKTPLNFRVVSYANDKFQPHSVERLTEDGTKYDTTFTCGDYVTNGTKMRGSIERFELSPDLSSLFVFTDWSGVGMDLDSISRVPTKDIMETLHIIEGIFHGYAQSNGPDAPFSMLNNGKEIYFEMHKVGKTVASTPLKRSYLETLDHDKLAEVVIKNIEEVFHSKLPSAHQVNDRVRVFLMPEGEESFPGFTAYIKGVHFYKGKVKYDLEIRFYGDMATRIYNIDSVLVMPYDAVPIKRKNLSIEDTAVIFEDLFKAIEHGDQEHRDWLKNEMNTFLKNYFCTKPVTN